MPTNLISWKALGSSLLTNISSVQMCKNGSSKRTRNEYCNLTVGFFLVYLIFVEVSPTYFRAVCLHFGGNWMKSNMVVLKEKQTQNYSLGIQIHTCAFHRLIHFQGSHLWVLNNVYPLFSFSVSTILEPKYHEKTTFPIILTPEISPGAY